MLVAMLITPLIGTVIAGKGQEKMSFELQIAGAPDMETGKSWDAGNNVQVRGRIYILAHPEDTFILIDVGGANQELIQGDCLDYYGEMYTKNHAEKGWYVTQVREVISIYETSAKENLRGTLEIKALGNTHGDNGPATNFVGHGTMEFEGVTVMGNTEPALITLPPPELIVQLNRVGTVMGWPTT